MTNTLFRLTILVPAAVLFAYFGVSSFEAGGVISFVLAAVIAAIAVALIVWTLADHRKRARAKDGFNA